MKPYSQIFVGDIYESPLKWTGSNVTYAVINKDEQSKLIEVRSSYQHPSLPETIWKNPADRLFSQRKIFDGRSNRVVL